MSSAPDTDALARLRRICFDFGGTEEKLSHGAPFFHVRGRGFAVFASGHHGERAAAWVKSTAEEQRRLVRSDPGRYFVPPYVGVKGWVGVRIEGDGDGDAELAILVEEAWRSVVPKRLEHAAPTAPKEVPVYATTDPAHVQEALARLTAWAAALPGAEVEPYDGGATLRVGKRPVAYLLDNHHRDGLVGVSFRSDDGASLTREHPKRYYLPAYMGPKGWVAMRVDAARVPWATLRAHVTESYARVAPRGGAGSPRSPRR